MKEKKKVKKEKYYGRIFLGFVILLYLLIFLLKPVEILKSLSKSGDLFIHIIPVLIIVILFMGLMNCFVYPKIVSKYVGKGSGIRGWFLAISGGILSHGPIYVWYPLLMELRKKGMRSGLIAAFLYSRSIKIPLLPLMVYYFGITMVVVLVIYTIIASIIEGKIIEVIKDDSTAEYVA